MRLNKFIAQATGLSRRAADTAIERGRIEINGEPVVLGQEVVDGDVVTLDKRPIAIAPDTITIMLNKPAGYVCSRDGQGSKTIYDLVPSEYWQLKPVGRLDKDSSGLLLMTNDGNLAQELTHPSKQKTKVYEITLQKSLAPLHRQMISDHGLMLEDGLSKLQLMRLEDGDDTKWQVTMSEGRNRQIRRTFAPLGYRVNHLHRTQFGNYHVGNLASGTYEIV